MTDLQSGVESLRKLDCIQYLFERSNRTNRKHVTFFMLTLNEDARLRFGSRQSGTRELRRLERAALRNCKFVNDDPRRIILTEFDAS